MPPDNEPDFIPTWKSFCFYDPATDIAIGEASPIALTLIDTVHGLGDSLLDNDRLFAKLYMVVSMSLFSMFAF